MKEQSKLEAIAMAIQLRDNWKTMENNDLAKLIEDLAKTNVFSLRQIGTMCQKSSSTISRMAKRNSKTGGRLNPEHLEIIRGLIFQNNIGQIDWHRVERLVNTGTSIYMLAKITGIPRSTIHRKVSVGSF